MQVRLAAAAAAAVAAAGGHPRVRDLFCVFGQSEMAVECSRGLDTWEGWPAACEGLEAGAVMEWRGELMSGCCHA